MSLDLAVYRKYNDDLANLDDQALTIHYQTYGQTEYRIANQADVNKRLANYDATTYRQLNPDLASLSDDDLQLHWLKYGYREGRRSFIPKDYSMQDGDWEYVRVVDFRGFVKRIDEVCERVANFANKIQVPDDRNFKAQDFANGIIDAINKTDNSLNRETKRHLFTYAFPFLIEYLYAKGTLYQAEYTNWRYAAARDVKLFDEFYVRA